MLLSLFLLCTLIVSYNMQQQATKKPKTPSKFTFHLHITNKKDASFAKAKKRSQPRSFLDSLGCKLSLSLSLYIFFIFFYFYYILLSFFFLLYVRRRKRKRKRGIEILVVLLYASSSLLRASKRTTCSKSCYISLPSCLYLRIIYQRHLYI